MDDLTHVLAIVIIAVAIVLYILPFTKVYFGLALTRFLIYLGRAVALLAILGGAYLVFSNGAWVAGAYLDGIDGLIIMVVGLALIVSTQFLHELLQNLKDLKRSLKRLGTPPSKSG